GRAARKESDLLVVADRPRRRPGALRYLADAKRSVAGQRAHAAASKSSAGSASLRTWAGRSIDTTAPSRDTPVRVQRAVCMLAMKGSSCAVESPDVSPAKILKSTSFGTSAVTPAGTYAHEST